MEPRILSTTTRPRVATSRDRSVECGPVRSEIRTRVTLELGLGTHPLETPFRESPFRHQCLETGRRPVPRTMSTSALVIGSNGFVGRRLVAALLEQGVSVQGVS